MEIPVPFHRDDRDTGSSELPTRSRSLHIQSRSISALLLQNSVSFYHNSFKLLKILNKNGSDWLVGCEKPRIKSRGVQLEIPMFSSGLQETDDGDEIKMIDNDTYK